MLAWPSRRLSSGVHLESRLAQAPVHSPLPHGLRSLTSFCSGSAVSRARATWPEVVHAQNRVGVAAADAELLVDGVGALVEVFRAGAHDKAAPEALHQHLPVFLVFVGELAAGAEVLLLEKVRLGGRPGEVAEGLAREAARDVEVAQVDLGPGLLEQHHPERVVLAVAERGSARVRARREVVVQEDFLPNAVDANGHRVEPLRVVLPARNEQPFQPLRVDRDGPARRQEVAVAQLALNDALGVDALEHAVILGGFSSEELLAVLGVHQVEVFRPQPHQRRVRLSLGALHEAEQRLLHGRELVVLEVPGAHLQPGLLVLGRVLQQHPQVIDAVGHARRADDRGQVVCLALGHGRQPNLAAQGASEHFPVVVEVLFLGLRLLFAELDLVDDHEVVGVFGGALVLGRLEPDEVPAEIFGGLAGLVLAVTLAGRVSGPVPWGR